MMLTIWYVFLAKTTVCGRRRTELVSDMIQYAIGPTVRLYVKSHMMHRAAWAHNAPDLLVEAERMPMSTCRRQRMISPER